MAPLRRNWFIFATLACATAASAAPVRTDHMESELVAENLAIQPGKPFVVGLRLKPAAHWHTYWVSPGDSGQATAIEWKLPAGFSAGEIQWPQPTRLPTPPYMTFGYDGEVLLMTTITPPADLAPGTRVKLDAHADWLVCRNECVPGSADYSIELPVESGPPAADPVRAPLFASTRNRLPVIADKNWSATFALAGGEIVLNVRPPAGTTVNPDDLFFYPLGDSIIEPAEKQTATFANGTITIRVVRAKIAGVTPKTFSGVLVAKGGFPPALADRAVQIDAEPAPAGAATKSAPLSALILFFGFLGGMILNLMPCVFPVLGIKVLGFVHQSGSDRRKVTMHGVVFTIGVLISFWVLAGMLAALHAGGRELGWGFQLQYPEFVFCLSMFMLVFALNLSGLFEVGLSATSVGGSLQMKEGYAGSFFTGVLATVVSTPCAAPFLAPALGAAVTLPPVQSFTLFTVIGLGLSMPYLVLSIFPNLVKLLPRPGAWMETFKQLMAFPLYATVVYFLWVLSAQIDGPKFLLALLSMVLIAMAAWSYGRFVQQSGTQRRRGFGFALALVFAVAAVGVGFPWTAGAASSGHEQAEIDWKPWSPEAVAKLRAEGKPVYVDFTARWCVTCQVNKARVFASQEVRDAFARKQMVSLEADWTKRDPAITRALASFGRAAVPLNLIYVPGLDEPIILSEFLSPSQVLEALERVPTPKSVAATP